MWQSRFYQRCAWAVLLAFAAFWGFGVISGQAVNLPSEPWWVFTAENPTPVTGALLKAWACSESEFYFSDRHSNVLFNYKSGIVTRSYTTASQIIGIGGASCSDVTMVTNDGWIYHYDGASWSILSNSYRNLMQAWVGSSTAIYATAGSGINFYNGVEWTVMPGTSGWSYTIYGIWGLDPSNVYAVGQNGLLAYYNGTSWSTTTITPGASFSAVWARSTSDVYVSGLYGSVWRYNGTSWQLIRTGSVTDSVFAIGGTASTTFIVGSTYSGSLQGPLLEQYDGSIWTQAAAAYVSPYYRVVAASGSHVYVVGEVGAILHYDGATWQEVSQRVAVSDLTAAWGSGPNDIFAVGLRNQYAAYNSPVETVLHYNGSAWSNIAPVGYPIDYKDVWGSAPNDVYAVGNPFTHNTVVMHYDGAEWAPITSTLFAHANAIWGSGPNDIFVLGDNAQQTLGIHHFDGNTWSEMITPALPPLYDIWGSGPNDVFAVGYYGEIVHYDGNTWTEAPWLGITTPLNSVWGSGPNDVYAVGNNGVLLHYNGTNWSKLPSIGTEHLTSVRGYSSTDVFVGGTFLWYYHFDGTTWNMVTSPVTNILALWGDHPGQMRLFGSNGQIVNAVVERKVFLPFVLR